MSHLRHNIAHLAISSSCCLLLYIIYSYLTEDRKVIRGKDISITYSDVATSSKQFDRRSKPNVIAKQDFLASAKSNNYVLDGMLEDFSLSTSERNPNFLYKKLRSEKREEPWASYSEKALSQNFRDIPYLNGPPQITCGSTLCEVFGSVANDVTIDKMNVAMIKLQGLEVIPTDELYSFDNRLVSTSFGISKTKPVKNTFVRYVFRKRSGYSAD